MISLKCLTSGQKKKKKMVVLGYTEDEMIGNILLQFYSY